MDRKDWLRIEVLLEFIFIYIVSFFSMLSFVLSIQLFQDYRDFLSIGLFTIGIILFTLVSMVFADVLDNVEEWVMLNIKESEKNGRRI